MSKEQAASGFSTRSRLKKAGGSLVLTVPATARNMLGLTEGQEMMISVVGQQVIAEAVTKPQKTMKVRKPKYTLDELLEGYEQDRTLTAEERTWIDSPPVGNETW